MNKANVEVESATASGRTICDRHGVSMVEMVVALAVFGTALSGLGPHVIMHIKHLRNLEDRLDPEVTHYLVPSLDPWARKIGAPASIVSIDPGTIPPVADVPPNNKVEIVSLDKPLTGEEVTVSVTVEAMAP